MIFAVLGSIDGHDRALEAALEAIEEAGILTILHTGNAVVGHSGSNQVLDLLQEFQVQCVPGNRDRLAVRYSRKQQTLDKKLDPELREQLRWTHDNLTSLHLETLRGWRKNQRIELEGLTVFLCHGSPGNPREILDAETPTVKLQRQREQAGADIVVCGGADQSFSRLIENTLFLAPGPLLANANTARYALVNTEELPWTVSLEEVAIPA